MPPDAVILLPFPAARAAVRRGHDLLVAEQAAGGHLHLPRLRAALEARFTKNVTDVSQNEDQKVV